ncbi:DNA mismatch repair protein, partial [Tyrophagus putrescentiae]
MATPPTAQVLGEMLQELERVDQELRRHHQAFLAAIDKAQSLKAACSWRAALLKASLETHQAKLESHVAQDSRASALVDTIQGRLLRVGQIQRGLQVLNEEPASSGQRSESGVSEPSATTATTQATETTATTAATSSPSSSSSIVQVMDQESCQQRLHRYLLARRQEADADFRIIGLKSVANLQKATYEARDAALLDAFVNGTFVGCTDGTLLMQHNQDLLQVHLEPLNRQLMQQLLLAELGNFDYITFNQPLPLARLLAIYQQHHPLQSARPVESALEPLLKCSDMLKDYFSLLIDSTGATLQAIPRILEGHMPVMALLPDLVYSLCNSVEWHDEEKCLRDVSRQLAAFYSRPPKVTTEQEHKEWAGKVERLFFPLYQKLLVPTTQLAAEGAVVTLTSATELANFFGHC